MNIREVKRGPTAEARRWELWLCVPDERFNDPPLGSWRCSLHVSPWAAHPRCLSLLSPTCSQPSSSIFPCNFRKKVPPICSAYIHTLRLYKKLALDADLLRTMKPPLPLSLTPPQITNAGRQRPSRVPTSFFLFCRWCSPAVSLNHLRCTFLGHVVSHRSPPTTLTPLL